MEDGNRAAAIAGRRCRAAAKDSREAITATKSRLSAVRETTVCLTVDQWTFLSLGQRQPQSEDGVMSAHGALTPPRDWRPHATVLFSLLL